MGILILNSGPAIAIEGPLSQPNGNTGDVGLTTTLLDASNAPTPDLVPMEEGNFTSQTDAGTSDFPSPGSCPAFSPLFHFCSLWGW